MFRWSWDACEASDHRDEHSLLDPWAPLASRSEEQVEGIPVADAGRKRALEQAFQAAFAPDASVPFMLSLAGRASPSAQAADPALQMPRPTPNTEPPEADGPSDTDSSDGETDGLLLTGDDADLYWNVCLKHPRRAVARPACVPPLDLRHVIETARALLAKDPIGRSPQRRRRLV